MNLQTLFSALALLLVAIPAAQAADTRLEFPVFGAVEVSKPNARADSIALLLAADPQSREVTGIRSALADMGALVVTIDGTSYLAALAQANGRCRYPAADFENLSHAVQKRLKVPQYLRPVLMGVDAGASLAYAILAQAPRGTFSAALTLGMHAELAAPGLNLCQSNALRTRTTPTGALAIERVGGNGDPWVDLSDNRRQLVALRAAYRTLVDRTEPDRQTPPNLADLPLVEVPTADRSSPLLALLVTGDGGWAGLDRDMSAQFAAAGVPVIGFNSLKYFWTPRTPERVAQDVERVLRHYLAAWERSRVLLIGYSFGADVLPFVVNRLPEDLRSRVASLTLVGVGLDATFEVHVAEWLPGLAPKGEPIAPEIARMAPVPLLCLYGRGDKTLCTGLERERASVVEFGAGHHLGGDYGALAKRILDFARLGRR